MLLQLARAALFGGGSPRAAAAAGAARLPAALARPASARAGDGSGSGSEPGTAAPDSSSSDLGAVLTALERNAAGLKDSKAVEAALVQVERCARGMDAEALRRELHATSTWQMLADMAVASASAAPPEVVARMIGVFGRMRFGDQMVLDELARSLMGQGVQQLPPDAMAEVVAGLRGADHSPSVLLLDALHERVSDLSAEGALPEEQAREMADAMRALGREDTNVRSEPDEAGQPDRIKYT